MPCQFYVAVTAVNDKRTLIAGADGKKNHMTGRGQTVRGLMLFKGGENVLEKRTALITEQLKITGHLHVGNLSPESWTLGTWYHNNEKKHELPSGNSCFHHRNRHHFLFETYS